jgi:hypothetical protein
MSDEMAWEVTVPIFSNTYFLSDVLVILFICATILAGFVLVIFGVEDYYLVLKFLLLGSGVLVVLLIGVMGLVFVSIFEMRIRIDDDGVFSSLVDFTSNSNRLTWKIGVFAQNLSLTGSSMLAMDRESIQVNWGSVGKVAIDEEKRVITLSTKNRPLIRLYCLPENIRRTVVLVEKHLPDADFLYH